MKPDYYDELREECGPLGLPASQEFSEQEALQVFVISDHINQMFGTLKVMISLLESFKDSQELIVMDIIILLGLVECV